MSLTVPVGGVRVVLPLRTRLEGQALAPKLGALLVAQARVTGLARQTVVPMGALGIPRPFAGQLWCHEWRIEGDGAWACWIGFPDAFFGPPAQAGQRVAVEALGHLDRTETGRLRSLGRVEITLARAGGPPWMPQEPAGGLRAGGRKA